MKSVSVIIRAYNAEKYIRHAINSVLSQDYDGPIEVIVCYDEGTRDNTLSVIKDFSGYHHETRIVNIYRHTHLTPFRSLQKCGLANSKGDYIMILDYDNIMPINYVSTMVKNAECSKAQFLFSNMLLIDENGNVIGERRPKKGFTLKDMILGNLIDGNTIMLQKDYAKKINNEFNGVLNKRFFDDIFEDWLIALLALKDCKSYHVEDAYILYRIHEENITAGSKDLYKTLDNLKRDISTLLAFYELRGDRLSKEELMALQLSLIKRYTWSMRSTIKYRRELNLLKSYSLLMLILEKAFEKLVV